MKDFECKPNEECGTHMGGGNIHVYLHAKYCTGFITGSVCIIRFCNIRESPILTEWNLEQRCVDFTVKFATSRLCRSRRL